MMNDAEAIDAINEIFDKYCDNGLHELAALSRIGRVLGLNTAAHVIAKQANGVEG
jgi:hypothetical protein